ncbi:hypothetical protein BGX24_002120 [Mortierella sp. AD032]|nr:hypothetical protein BGX24_002120 [Mortierella sp. AD032]
MDQVAMYINNLGDLMCECDKARLHALIPAVAVQELFFKMRGRFRPIVTTIEDIIMKGSTSYWREAIERRVQAMAHHPGRFLLSGSLCSQIKRMLNKVAKRPAEFKDAVQLRHVLRQIVICQASLGLSWSLPGEERILIESAIARLRKTSDGAAGGKTTVSTVVDEPFVIQAAYNFIQEEDEEFYSQFRYQYGDSEIFELHAPLDLIYAFHKKQLKQGLFSVPKPAEHQSTTALGTLIPAFEPVSFPRHLFAHGHLAIIVGWEEYLCGSEYKGMLTMNDFMEAHYNNGSRKDGHQVPPFYYSEPSNPGPDIIFVLQIDHQLYPVFVQTKLFGDTSEVASPKDVEEARLIVHETNIKTHLPNLAMYCPGGKYLSLLYYVHSTIDKTSLREAETEATRRDHNNRAWDSTDGDNTRLTQLLMIIDSSNIRDFVPEGVVDLHECAKGTKRVLVTELEFEGDL